MNVKALVYSLLSILFYSGCRQLKSLTAQDNSANKPTHKKTDTREILFLEDISVTPGQSSTSKHSTINSSVPGSSRSRKATTGGYSNYPAGVEGSDWLQLKYALILNASPENLNNAGLLKLIDEWWGTPYSMGGSTKDGIDCSAFTQLLLSNIYQVQLPRTAQEQFKKCEKVDDDQLQEGDLVFFTSGRTIAHVGVFITNNKFVHASTSQGVMISDLTEAYWKNKYKGAGRVKTD